jgi:hypothetical protein
VSEVKHLTAEDVFYILGHRSHYDLVATIRRLQAKPRLNSREQKDELVAALWAFHNPYAYSRECKWRRDNPTIKRNLWTAAQLKAFAS